MILVVFLVCSLYLPWTRGEENSSSAHIVHQSPSALIKNHGSSVDQEINCSHSIANYDRMLWYKQDISRTLKLLGYLNLNFAYSEEYVKGKIRIQGDGRSYGNFSISGLKQEDSAVYFCAVLPHQATSLNSNAH
uniref:Immunoglobulin V-set domain-containing protein n=1 Tax=Oncorhynchus tshawytscha TaxID=74940 RepID=A0AAZ3QZK1_ONCTS